MDYKDYYAVLGVPRTATTSDIKKAFRKLAREHHPDAKPGDSAAERRFKEINEANAVLSVPDKRSLYDRLGADWESYARAGAATGAAAGGGPFSGGFAAGGGPFARSGPGGGGIRYEFHSTDGGGFSDFFNAFFAGASQSSGAGAAGRGRQATGGSTIEDLLAGMGTNADGARTGSRRGPAAEAIADITLDEAFHGTTRVVEIEGKRLEVSIPKGASTGTRIRLSGKAPGGGDVHVVVQQTPDPVFRRTGADLERDLPLTVGEALLGAQVPVQSPRGRVLLTIPAGTQTGRTFRLTGRGMPKFKATGFGDLLVRTRIVIPTDLSDEARDATRHAVDLIDQPDPRTRET